MPEDDLVRGRLKNPLLIEHSSSFPHRQTQSKPLDGQLTVKDCFKAVRLEAPPLVYPLVAVPLPPEYPNPRLKRFHWQWMSCAAFAESAQKQSDEELLKLPLCCPPELIDINQDLNREYMTTVYEAPFLGCHAAYDTDPFESLRRELQPLEHVTLQEITQAPCLESQFRGDLCGEFRKIRVDIDVSKNHALLCFSCSPHAIAPVPSRTSRRALDHLLNQEAFSCACPHYLRAHSRGQGRWDEKDRW